VAKLRRENDFGAIKPLLREAYAHSLRPTRQPTRANPGR
jgi:hypothetical protein